MRNFKEPEIGDRYRRVLGEGVWYEWEYTHNEGVMRCGTITKTSRRLRSKKGDVILHLRDHKDTYLGNFNKSDNFNNLYEKLNSWGQI